jgi:hypothetical protein
MRRPTSCSPPPVPVLSALRDQTGESAQLYLRRADECTDHSRCWVPSRLTRLRLAVMPCPASSSVMNR